MHNQTVGMGPLPAGIGVGGKPGMHRGNGRFIISVLQICKKQPKLLHQKHAFVYNGTAGQGYHIGVVAGLLENTSCHIKPPVKIQSPFHPFGPLYKPLHDIRHTVYGFLAKLSRSNGYVPPAQKFHAFFFYNDFKHFSGLVPF